MGVRENKVETYLNDQIESIGGITYKWTSPGRRGVPDRIIIFKGTCYFAEVKTPNGSLSTNQVREMNKITRAGIHVLVITGHEGVVSFINWLKERS